MSGVKIHMMEQGTDEWFAVRKGKVTGSNAQAIGNYGKGLDTYIVKILSEYYSSAKRESFTNKHIERGNLLEPIARGVYEMQTGEEVEEVGFIEHSEFVGCSPDGFVGKDGGIEIKCLSDDKYLELWVHGEKKIEAKYIRQMNMNMLVSGRKWWDFVAYNPNFPEVMYIKRFEIDEEKKENLIKGFEKSEKLILSIKDKLKW